jgi:hypothetical protein
MNVNKVLPVTLTPDEIAVKANELASVLQEITTKTDDAKAYVAASKIAIKELQAKMMGLGAMVRDHIEYRQVKCTEVRNDIDMTVETVRMDTGERVGIRAMDESERQLKMFPMPVSEAGEQG